MRNFSSYVNKIIKFRFCGKDLDFSLSHALFSSFDIDEGTRLLLKGIAQHIDLESTGSCLDIGCGVGVIGISVHGRLPRASFVMQDRDALAAAFAEENSRANEAEGIEVQCGLAFHGMEGRSFDLVTSNLPAKAGQPVLEAFFRSIAAFLTPRGVAAIVVVAPLVPFVLSTLKAFGYQVVHSETTKRHTALHFRCGARSSAGNVSPSDLTPYIRGKQVFSVPDVSYEIETAWSLPDFDTLGYSLSLSFDVLRIQPVKGELLVWNPGQGHVAAYLLRRHGRAISGVSLASRDSLELEITRRNLRTFGREPRVARSVPSEIGLLDILPRASIDFLCAAPHPIPRVPWQPEMAEAAEGLVKPGGMLFIVSTSTEAHRFLADLHGWRLIESRKQFGRRALLLKHQ
jgi:SAM-dependent methyltransferase